MIDSTYGRIGLALTGTFVGVVALIIFILTTMAPSDLVLKSSIEPTLLPKGLYRYALQNRGFDANETVGNGLRLLTFSMNGYIDKNTARNVAIYEVMDILIRKGADPNAVSEGAGQGLRPLHLAVNLLSEDLVRFLLGRGADPDLRAGPGKFRGMTALEYANYLKSQGRVDPERIDSVAKLLAAEGE